MKCGNCGNEMGHCGVLHGVEDPKGWAPRTDCSRCGFGVIEYDGRRIQGPGNEHAHILRLTERMYELTCIFARAGSASPAEAAANEIIRMNSQMDLIVEEYLRGVKS